MGKKGVLLMGATFSGKTVAEMISNDNDDELEETCRHWFGRGGWVSTDAAGKPPEMSAMWVSAGFAVV